MTYIRLEALKQNLFSAIKSKAALCDKSSVVMEKQTGLQETEITRYEDIYKKAIFNRRRKESARLGIKSEVDEGAIADEWARFKQGFR